MRDRLMELIEKAAQMWDENPLSSFNEVCADHLLANGVIVPPVRVGQTVYKISRNKVKECEVVFAGLSADEKCSHFIFVENYADGTFYKSYSMGFNLIGKTVFLSREDAERALKGGGGE